MSQSEAERGGGGRERERWENGAGGGLERPTDL